MVDDHITGVLSEHQSGKLLDIPPTGTRLRGRRSTPGRYFQVARPGTGWGGTDIADPLSILEPFDPRHARAGMRMLMVSTTGEHAAYYELDAALRPVARPMPEALAGSVACIAENCEPALCSVVFVGGAGGSLRAGVTDNPVRLTRAVSAGITRLTSGGAPTYRWPGGRSFSRGIADAVTVLARTAAAADAAATVVANAVDLPGHPGILRRPASGMQPDSDLGEVLVTCDVAPLSGREIGTALTPGLHRAETLAASGDILSVALHLQGRSLATAMHRLPQLEDAHG